MCVCTFARLSMVVSCDIVLFGVANQFALTDTDWSEMRGMMSDLDIGVVWQ